MISCRDDLSALEWDMCLEKLGGHPLQSALWGNAKRDIYGIADERLALYSDNQLVALARIEKRGIQPWLMCAWIPQGPIITTESNHQLLQHYLSETLKKRHYSAYAAAPWNKANFACTQKNRKTVWIDLQCGQETLWGKLDKQWRYGVGRARRQGVTTHIANTDNELSDFYRLCVRISKEKKFHFQQSEAFLRYLLIHGNQHVLGKLFLAKQNQAIVAGAFVLQLGKNIHYMFGAVDRQYASSRAGELIQWSVIEWACEQHCARYDLEGIDPDECSSVAAFKKKMGGEVITLSPTEIQVINKRGKLLLPLMKKKLG